MRLRTGPFMSDEVPIPRTLRGVVRWAINNHPWVFFLIALERVAERDYDRAALFAVIWLTNLFIASQWETIGNFWRRQKLLLVYVGLGALGLLLIGVAIGGLWGSRITIASPSGSYTGRIAWNFEQAAKGEAYFLNMGKLNQGEIRVVGFGAHGKNTSKDPITEFKGFVRSDITNAVLPIYLYAQNPDLPDHPDPFQSAYIPTLPEETFGIPGLADFDIVTHNMPVIQTGVDGMPLSKFLRDFASFTVVLEYDGTKVERRFTTEEIKRQVTILEKSIDPTKSVIPRVTRKRTATPPPPPALMVLPLQVPQLPQQQQNGQPPEDQPHNGKSK
jgi:hypothetical protein